MEASICALAFQTLRMNGYNVDQALEYPFYAILDRIAKRKNIEHYNFDSLRFLKTSYSSPKFGNKDFLFLSVEDFNRCQMIHREELRELERWVIENRLDELKFARSKSAYCYFSAAATFFAPELSDARMAWAKNGILTTVVDDFFDVGGSVEELKDLIRLVELCVSIPMLLPPLGSAYFCDDLEVTVYHHFRHRWDVNVSTECSSNNVQIIFSALWHTICEIGDKGFKLQGRIITDNIIAIWLDLLYSMMKETEWARDKFIPTIDEYMSNAYVSFALGPIVLSALYLVGPKLSEEMVNHSEYHSLFKSMSTCGRLLNDIRGYEREIEDGKLNALSLYMINNGGEITKEAAILELKSWIDTQRRELLRLVLEGNNSVLPKSCKELFGHMCSVVHLFYSKDDGFTSQGLIQVVNAIIHEPIALE
ncbi:Terpenoid cyclases/Protein prenyltransferases superfamily protein [Perilla frutescens var. frutescens]|nr:Terpenoid cyclases/Protein prenyltransferases superfamily protein [Perilla frutescens var. frutescens]